MSDCGTVELDLGPGALAVADATPGTLWAVTLELSQQNLPEGAPEIDWTTVTVGATGLKAGGIVHAFTIDILEQTAERFVFTAGIDAANTADIPAGTHNWELSITSTEHGPDRPLIAGTWHVRPRTIPTGA